MTKEQIQEYTLRISQANHSGLILVLTDICITYINDSIKCYADSDAIGYKSNIDQALKAQNELIDCFNPADTLGREVVVLLRYIYGRLVSSQVKSRPVDLEATVDMLGRLKVSFEKLHEIDDEGPVMKNTHQVYAGLTYGKGSLNESVAGADVASRGYFA